MLRASSQGLSFALSTVTYAIPWRVTYSTRSQTKMRPIERAVLSSTGTRHAGEDAYPKRPNALGRRARSLSHGQSGNVLVGMPVALQEMATVPIYAKVSKQSGIGSRKIQGREKGMLVRRIGPLRSLSPRFLHPRLEKNRNRRSVIPASEKITGQIEPQEYPKFLRHSGIVKSAYWKRSITDPLLRAIDAACAGRNICSPSPIIYQHLLQLSEGQDLQYVWESYLDLVRLQSTHPAVEEIFPSSQTPHRLLWRLCHFIIRFRPITSAHFPFLLMVLQHLWDMGRHPSQSEWNTLISMAAKGQRGGGSFHRSLSILNDFIKGRRPGSSIGTKLDIFSVIDPNSPNQPDIYTFSILIHIAAEALDAQQLRDTTLLFKQSGLAPTRITHLSLLKFYAKKRQLSGVRSAVRNLHEDGMDLGTDGINACLWAYTLNAQFQIALDVYRVLRNNVQPDPDPQIIARLRKSLETQEHIHITPHARPDHRTYVVLIQTMAYHGNFSDTFTIFGDFLENTPRGRLDPSTSPAFRAIFMGFCKYAVGRLEESVNPSHPKNRWNLANLRRVYRLFLKLPKTVIPTRTTLYYILVAFDKASDHDIYLMRELWLELEGRYAPMAPVLFRQPRLQRIKTMLFPTGRDDG